MSITFGIYDFFSYTIPGVLYILVVNRLLAFLKLPNVDVSSLNVDFGKALLWIVLAYVVGHLMDSFSIRLYYLINKFNAEIKAMKEFKNKNKKLVVDFTIHDRKSLFSVVRHNNLDLALFIDNFKAMSFMLNNISLALLLLSIEQIVEIFVGGFSYFALVVVVVSSGFAYVAINRSAVFNEWHWLAVYQHARQYGKSIPEMFNSSSKAPAKNTTTKNK